MRPVLYTIGHSNQDTESFLRLLRDNAVQVVADVRSAPYSRYVPQYNKKEIESAVTRAGFKYIFMGDAIGGKPDGREYLNEDGRVMYDKLAVAASFQQGLDRLIRGMEAGFTIALMCAEENPLKCHRHHLLARELELKRGIPVWHIRADNARMRAKKFLNAQLGLFQGGARKV